VSGEIDACLVGRFQRLASRAGVLVGLAGSLVLAGWTFDVAALKRLVPGLSQMAASAALAFLLSGISLWLRSRGRSPSSRRLADAGALLVTLAGLAALAEYLLVGEGHVVFERALVFGPMAPMTGLSFVLSGLALTLLDRPRGFPAAPALALAAGALGLLVFLGYVFESAVFFKSVSSDRMAMSTAVVFGALNLGILFARPQRGPMRVIASTSAGGWMARRLLPAAVLVVPLLGWLRWQGERVGLYSSSFGLALMVATSVILMSVLIWWSAGVVLRMEWEWSRAKEGQRRWEQVFQHAAWGVVLVDPGDHRMLAVNAAFARMHGYAVEELVGRSLADTLAPECRPELAAHAAAANRTGHHVYESMHLRQDGTTFPALTDCTAIGDPNGQVLYRAANVQDLTERRAAEERFRALWESAPDAMVSADQSGHIVLVNSQAEKSFGYRQEELLGQPIELLIPERLVGEHRRRRSEYLQKPRPRPMGRGLALAARRKDGTEFPAEISLSPLQTPQGVIVTSVIRDITERKLAQEALQSAHDELELRVAERTLELARANEALQQQSRRLEQVSRLKSEFLANMSHELRTPLNAIIGFAELMQDGRAGLVSPRQRQFLEHTLTSARHLLRLINDVLDLSKVESGRVEFRPEPVAVAKLIEEVEEIVRPLSAEKRIRLETEVEPGLTEVVLDPARFKQVLYNYLSNALKFTPEAGRVTVRARAEGTEAFRLEVEDSGIGIRPEDLERLFVEFQQLDAGAAKKHQGTGLGLALTKRIVEAQGGRVGVCSTPGQGSVFSAVLPRVAAATPPPREPAGAGGPRVLIIEDDAQDRAWLVRVLTVAGYAVETATTGAEALARCRQRPFGAVTLDLLLPDRSGWEVLRAIRDDGPNRDVPVIVVTVATERGIAAGFPIQDFLSKPVRAEDLLASLERAGVTPDGTRRVLVVEDDAAAAALMEAILRDLGFQPVCAPDAETGLQALLEQPPAAVVLDLLLPGMDGFEFLARLRKTAAGHRLPVIVWTSKDLTAEEQTRLRASAQSVVLKNTGGTTVLLEALRACLPLGPAASASA
jgi:PAS domain S-box-containing protein